eukprot:702852-Rhodomonas_salina.2
MDDERKSDRATERERESVMMTAMSQTATAAARLVSDCSQRLNGSKHHTGTSVPWPALPGAHASEALAEPQRMRHVSSSESAESGALQPACSASSGQNQCRRFQVVVPGARALASESARVSSLEPLPVPVREAESESEANFRQNVAKKKPKKRRKTVATVSSHVTP